MKIIAVYKEDKDSDISRPIMVWPDSSLVRSGKPVFLPSFESGCEILIGMGIKIDRLGKSIRKEFSSRYFNEVTSVALILSQDNARNLQENKNLTTDFVADYTVVCGDFVSKESIKDDSRWEMKVSRSATGDEFKVVCDCSEFINDIPASIENASMRNTLKTGDIVVVVSLNSTLPAVKEGRVCVEVGNDKLLNFKIK